MKSSRAKKRRQHKRPMPQSTVQAAPAKVVVLAPAPVVSLPMDADALLTPQRVAAWLGVKEQTLAVWRTKGKYNLEYVKIGSRVMYRREAIEAFIAQSTRSTSFGS